MSARTGTLTLFAAAVVLMVSAFAPVLPAAAEEVHVTVYNGDLALVKDTRDVVVARGVGELSFAGVPARIDPTSVRLDPGKKDDLSILEQNYRFDLVSREKLLERYLDQPVQVVTKHDKLHEGFLKSTNGGLVLETEDGVVVVTADEIADLTLPEIPAGLITRPTLVWTVDNRGATDRSLEIAYLTGGMSWHAEYVAAVDAKDERMRLGGWVSIENRSGATYENARLKVVAGDVHRAQAPAPPVVMRNLAMKSDAMSEFQERSFFEYHIYDLGRATTIADREIKQIRLIADRTVPVVKAYVYEPTRGQGKIQVKLEFENTKKNELGIPLPAGKFRVYREDADGALEFAGEDFLDHTPRDEEVSIAIGNAFDLVGERDVIESRRITDRAREEKVRLKLRNRKDEDSVSILVKEHPGGAWKVLQSTHPWTKPKANDLEILVDVKAGEEVVIEYNVRSEY